MNSQTKKVVIICFSDFTKEPRVLRTIAAVSKDFELVIYSTKNAYKNFRVVDIEKLNTDFEYENITNKYFRKIKKIKDSLGGKTFGTNAYYHQKYWSKERQTLIQKLTQEQAHLYIGHGIYTVPLLAALNGKAKTIFNAHEYYLKEFEENESWKKYTQPYYFWIQENHLSKINKLFCVCETICQTYLKNVTIDSLVVTNARSHIPLSASHNYDGKVRLTHHGAALKGRNLKRTFDVIKFLPTNYELHVILMPTDLVYYNELKLYYQHETRIVFHNPVSINEIPNFINQFDIGIYILPPTNFNNLAALPNKFFEFIQARLCLAISPNPEMKRIIEEYKIGVTSTSFETEDLAKAILSITPSQLVKFKSNSDICAKELCAEVSEKEMLTAINQLLNA